MLGNLGVAYGGKATSIPILGIVIVAFILFLAGKSREAIWPQ